MTSWFSDYCHYGDEEEVSRRGWLSTAGGLVLTAAGLLLPSWWEEVDARESDRRGRAESGGGKRHRHRNRKQRRNRPNRKQPKLGDDGFEGILDIKFVFYNSAPTGTDAVTANCNYYKWNTEQSIGNSDDQTVLGGGSADFPTLVKSAALFIDGDKHAVWAKNPLLAAPNVRILSAGGRGGLGPTDMLEGDTISWDFAPYHIGVKRESDDNDHKVFSVYYKNDA